MSSKQLNSILSKLPAATAKMPDELKTNNNNDYVSNKLLDNKETNYEMERIVAQIPKILKEEIKSYIKLHKGQTERTIVLKALKSIGFNVLDSWVVDKRSTR